MRLIADEKSVTSSGKKSVRATLPPPSQTNLVIHLAVI
jgi:hypothetical protein